MSFLNCPRLSLGPCEISSSSEHGTWRFLSFENNTGRTDGRTDITSYRDLKTDFLVNRLWHMTNWDGMAFNLPSEDSFVCTLTNDKLEWHGFQCAIWGQFCLHSDKWQTRMAWLSICHLRTVLSVLWHLTNWNGMAINLPSEDFFVCTLTLDKLGWHGFQFAIWGQFCLHSDTWQTRMAWLSIYHLRTNLSVLWQMTN